MSPDHRGAPDASRREDGFVSRWSMTLSILLAVVAGLIPGVFSAGSLPSIVMTILLLALSFLAAVRPDLRRRDRS